jgi:hypothetical protein
MYYKDVRKIIPLWEFNQIKLNKLNILLRFFFLHNTHMEVQKSNNFFQGG